MRQFRPLPTALALCNVASKSVERHETGYQEERMRLSRLMFASMAAAALFAGSAAHGAEPVKIRLSWVAPVTNWASIS